MLVDPLLPLLTLAPLAPPTEAVWPPDETEVVLPPDETEVVLLPLPLPPTTVEPAVPELTIVTPVPIAADPLLTRVDAVPMVISPESPALLATPPFALLPVPPFASPELDVPSVPAVPLDELLDELPFPLTLPLLLLLEPFEPFDWLVADPVAEAPSETVLTESPIQVNPELTTEVTARFPRNGFGVTVAGETSTTGVTAGAPAGVGSERAPIFANWELKAASRLACALDSEDSRLT